MTRVETRMDTVFLALSQGPFAADAVIDGDLQRWTGGGAQALENELGRRCSLAVSATAAPGEGLFRDAADLFRWRGQAIHAAEGVWGPARGMLCNYLNIDPVAEEEFNDWYDTEHLPALAAVPGVLWARRYRALDPGRHRYLAIYRLADPHAAGTPAWRAAAATPWNARLKRFTSNYIRQLYAAVP
jgi:hypothetical protein